MKARLEAKGKSSEHVETFEAFYELIKQEARKLQQEYQPQLRNGIKIAVDLINSVQKDKKDGDVDVLVHIYPNAKKVKVTTPYPLSDVKNWDSKTGKTFGHTFTKHGKNQRKNLESRVETGHKEQGCWINDSLAAQHIETLKSTINSMAIGEVKEFSIPPSIGIVIYKDTTTNKIIADPATKMRLIRGSSKARAFIKTASPIK